MIGGGGVVCDTSLTMMRCATGPSNPQQQQVIVEALEKASFRVLDSHDKKRSVFRKMREDSPRFRGND
jgi:hypothetical protein